MLCTGLRQHTAVERQINPPEMNADQPIGMLATRVLRPADIERELMHRPKMIACEESAAKTSP